MNFKHIRLTYKFALQMVFFLLYLASIIGILMYFLGNINRASNVRQVFSDSRTLVIETYIAYNDFTTHTDSHDEFYQTGQNQYTIEFQEEINRLSDTLKSLMKSKALFRIEKITRSYDSVLASISAYNTTYNQLILGLKELGTANAGKTNLTLIDGRELSEAANNAGNSVWAGKFQSKETEFLFNPSQSAYYDLEMLISEPSIQSDMMLAEIAINHQNQLQDLNALFLRLGSVKEGTGLKGQFIYRYNKLKDDLEFFEKTVQSSYLKFKWFMMSLGIFMTLLMTSLYFYISIRFFRSIRKPLAETIAFSYDLAKGKNPEHQLSTSVAYEYSLINTNLNTINAALNEKREFVEDLLKQKFKADLRLQGKMDIFGKTLLALKENMRKTRDEQLKHAEDNQIRRFQNEGVAKFSDILRANSDNLSKLSDVFIREIVKYLEAIQGGLFLLEKEGDTELHLISSFAYNRKKYLQKTIRMGESLVGTCALEKKTINLTNIPSDYIEITSGLGDAPPDNLLLLPIMHEDHLIGVLEVASSKKFDSNQITLAEKITSSLASTIISARVNSQTSELLQKSQQQAAEMAEQEEEMRQNMEELKATQEESARREEELQGILNAIDQAFFVIEYDTEGIIQKINQRFLYLVNMPADKVIGKTHAQLFGKKSKADALLFANVSEGNMVELSEKVEVNNISLDLTHTFSPIKSKEGKSSRILNIISVNI